MMENSSKRFNSRRFVGLVEGTMIGAGEHCFRAACDLDLVPVFFSTDPDRYTFLSRYDCLVVKLDELDSVQLGQQMDRIERETSGIFHGIGTTDDAALDPIGEVAHLRGLSAAPLVGLRNCRNKDVTRELLRHQSPMFTRVGLETDIDTVLRDFQSDVVVKPTNQTSGIGVKRCSTLTDARDHIRSLLSASKVEKGTACTQVLVESFLSGPEVSVEVFNGHAIGVTQIEIDDTNGFVETCHLHPGNFSTELIAELRAMAEEAVATTGLTWGPAHIQYRIVGTTPYLIEINPRLGGGNVTQCVEYATGIRLAHAYIKSICGMGAVEAELQRRHDRYSSVQFVLTESSAPIASVQGLDHAAQSPGIVETGARTRVGHCYPIRGSNHDRLAFAISVADTAQEALDRADRAAELLMINVRRLEEA